MPRADDAPAAAAAAAAPPASLACAKCARPLKHAAPPVAAAPAPGHPAEPRGAPAPAPAATPPRSVTPEHGVSGATRAPSPGASSGMHASFVLVADGGNGAAASPAASDDARSDRAAQQPAAASAAAAAADALAAPLPLPAADRVAALALGALDVSSPMCAGCAARVQAHLDRELADARAELAAYEALLTHLQLGSADGGGEQGADEEEEEEAALAAEAARLEADLALLAADEASLHTSLSQCAAESAALDLQERECWHAVAEWQRSLHLFARERDAVNSRYMSATEHLAKLRATNVVNDAFRIWYDAHGGTIDGFRLGRTGTGAAGGGKAEAIDWAEINAGWGQACLMLETLAGRLEFEFIGYRLLPMGSTSKIQKLAPPPSLAVTATLDLHHHAATGAHPTAASAASALPSLVPPLGALLAGGTFDDALDAFLQCVAQLGAHCASLDANFSLPYAIRGDKIHDVHIRYRGGRRPGEWGKACKYVLTDLKWLMAFATKKVGPVGAAPPAGAGGARAPAARR